VRLDLARLPQGVQPARTGPSLVRIFEGTLAALARQGARQLSMTDVCDASGISRATLYRYFAKKEDLLAALAEHVSSNFVAGVKEAAAREHEPQEKFRAVLRFMIAYSTQVKSDRILEVEPLFVIESLHAQFPRHLAAVSEALDPVFDAFEKRLRRPLDRNLICELLLRAQESTSLIPAGTRWNQLPDTMAAFAVFLLGESASRPARSKRNARPARR
jgi:AcrR family transcriptional regulator